MYRTLLPACLIAMLTVSCSATGPVRTQVVDTACIWVNPIILTPEDVMLLSSPAKRAILTHNKAWKANCDNQTGKAGNDGKN